MRCKGGGEMRVVVLVSERMTEKVMVCENVQQENVRKYVK